MYRRRDYYTAAPRITFFECLALVLIVAAFWSAVAFVIYLIVRALKG